MYILLLSILFGRDVSDLGAPDFRTRERAEARLCRHADLALPLLDRPFADPEARRRARRVVGRAVPQNFPPLAVVGRPVAEWGWWDGDGTYRCSIGSYRPAGPWARLTYLRPDTHTPWAPLVLLYGERARTHMVWKDWHEDNDGREATRLLCGDLLRAGVPPCCVRALVRRLRAKEAELSGPAAPLSPRGSRQ